jgi:Zn-dependent M28 family amino/carboxypeptidase
VRKIVKLGIALLAVVTAAGLAEPVAGAATNHSSSNSSINGAVTSSAIFAREQVFQRLADQNNGLRAAGEPGYAAAVKYVEKSLDASGLDPREQRFSFPYFKELSPPLLTQVAPSAATYPASTFDYSGSADVTGAVVPTTNIDSSTSGCAVTDFPPIVGTAPEVALIKRGTCTFGDKILNAAAAGYAAAIVYNDGLPGRTAVVEATIGKAVAIPAIGTDYASGAALLAAARSGGSTVRVATRTINETRQTVNVIADTPGGDPNHVLLVAVQLDALPVGPGIVENASGVSAALEIAYQIHRLHLTPKYKIRFIFLGAEATRARRDPNGELVAQLGSNHYVQSLSAAQLSKIFASVDIHSIAAPNYGRFVFTGGPTGSDKIENVFTNYFTSIGLTSEPSIDFVSGQADFGPLADAGVPIGGVFGGSNSPKTAEEAAMFGGVADDLYDDCFHEACDSISNVNQQAQAELGDAAWHGIWKLATTNVGLFAAHHS